MEINPISARKQKLIDDLDASRSHLNAILDRIDTETQIYPDWKLKQFLDHVAGWDDAVITALRSHMDGKTPAVTAPYGIDYYNAQTVTTRESLPLERSRREYHETRRILKQAILDMPDEKFDVEFVSPWGDVLPLTEVVEVFVHHEREHAREIEQSLNAIKN